LTSSPLACEKFVPVLGRSGVKHASLLWWTLTGLYSSAEAYLFD